MILKCLYMPITFKWLQKIELANNLVSFIDLNRQMVDFGHFLFEQCRILWKCFSSIYSQNISNFEQMCKFLVLYDIKIPRKPHYNFLGKSTKTHIFNFFHAFHYRASFNRNLSFITYFLVPKFTFFFFKITLPLSF